MMIKRSREKGEDGWLDRSGRLLTALTFLGLIVVITITMKEVSYHGDEDDIDDEDGEDAGSDYGDGKKDDGDDNDKMER